MVPALTAEQDSNKGSNTENELYNRGCCWQVVGNKGSFLDVVSDVDHDIRKTKGEPTDTSNDNGIDGRL